MVVARARRLERFLTQPFFTTEEFSGLKGKLVSLEDALDGCEQILRDEFKDYPEHALYMIGVIDEARKTSKTGIPVTISEPRSKTKAEDDSMSPSDSKYKAKFEPQTKPEPNLKPGVEHAAADTHEP